MHLTLLVTHLLGSGHLARASALAQAFVSAGHRVTLISGGVPVPRIDLGNVRLIQLPPVKSNGVDFSLLLDEAGAPVTQSLLDKRVALAQQTLQNDPPDVFITELFPFGRRILRAEFLALLQIAQSLPNPPLVYSSIRDILAPPSKPAKAQMADEWVTTYYDGVLVHSDPDIAPLELSWPVSEKLGSKLRYTGFVAPPPSGPHPDGLGKGEIIVSAGGGSVGLPVYQAALQAAKLIPYRRWRILVGGQDAERTCGQLRRTAPENARVEPARPDFRQMLHHASASISMCGYNTALDLLAAGTPSVLIPFDDGNEVEQGLRAMALCKQAGFTQLTTDQLTNKSLAQAVTEIMNAPQRAPATGGFNGAARCVDIAEAEWDGRP